MPVKKFKDPSLPVQNSNDGSGRKNSKKGRSKTPLETPNLPLPAPTPEGPLPYQLRTLDTKSPIVSTSRGSTDLVQSIPSGSQTLAVGSSTRQYNKDKLKDSWNSLSGQTMEYLLEVDPKLGESRLKTLLRETKLKDIGVLLGISTEKVLLMEGHPTSIVGQAEASKLDDLLPALLNEVKRRGASIQVTERKAEVKLDQQK